MHRFGHRHARHPEQGGGKVHVREEDVAAGIGPHLARPTQETRHPNGLLPRLPFEAFALRPQHVAVVTGIKDDRVFAQAQFIQLGHQTAHLVVERRHHAVVLGNVLGRGNVWSGGIVVAHRELCGRVSLRITFRSFIRIVGRPPLNGEIERPRIGLSLAKKFDRQVCPAFGLELTQLDRLVRIAKIVVIEMPMTALVGRPKFKALAAGSWGNEARLAGSTIEMPLTHEAGAIAGVAQQLRETHRALAQPKVVGHHAVAMAVLPGEEYGARRATDGCIGKNVIENDAFRRKPIEVRRLDVGIAQAAHCMIAVLIGHQKKNVRALSPRCPGGSGGERAGGDKLAARKRHFVLNTNTLALRPGWWHNRRRISMHLI